MLVVGAYSADIYRLVSTSICNGKVSTVKADSSIEFIGWIGIGVIYIKSNGVAILNANVSGSSIRGNSLIVGTSGSEFI